MTPPADGRYPIHWQEVRVGRKTAYLGICSVTRKPCKIASRHDFIRVVAVRDLYIDKGACEEGRRCLNTECLLNRTTAESYAADLGFKRVPKWIRDQGGIKPIPTTPEQQAGFDKLCEEHKESTLVMYR